MKPPANMTHVISDNRAATVRMRAVFTPRRVPVPPVKRETMASGTAAIVNAEFQRRRDRAMVANRISFADRLRLERAGMGEARIREIVERARGGQ